MNRRKFLGFVAGLPLIGSLAMRLRGQEFSERGEILALSDCTLGRMQVIAPDGTVRATRKFGFPVEMRAGDSFVVMLDWKNKDGF